MCYGMVNAYLNRAYMFVLKVLPELQSADPVTMAMPRVTHNRSDYCPKYSLPVAAL